MLLLGLIFNILNFENGLGWISLPASWQSVVRGAFLLAAVVLQARLVARTEEAGQDPETGLAPLRRRPFC